MSSINRIIVLVAIICYCALTLAGAINVFSPDSFKALTKLTPSMVYMGSILLFAYVDSKGESLAKIGLAAVIVAVGINLISLNPEITSKISHNEVLYNLVKYTGIIATIVINIMYYVSIFLLLKTDNSIVSIFKIVTVLCVIIVSGMSLFTTSIFDKNYDYKKEAKKQEYREVLTEITTMSFYGAIAVYLLSKDDFFGGDSYSKKITQSVANQHGTSNISMNNIINNNFQNIRQNAINNTYGIQGQQMNQVQPTQQPVQPIQQPVEQPVQNVQPIQQPVQPQVQEPVQEFVPPPLSFEVPQTQKVESLFPDQNNDKNGQL